jgi:hypothetical protein
MAAIKKDKKEKIVTISSKVAYQNSGILFELNESYSFNSTEFTLEEIDQMKTQLLTNNLISINNFQKKLEET